MAHLSEKNLADKLHKFMGSLTECVYSMHGKTVLYVPRLNDRDSMSLDIHELISRFESTLVHWTRQIERMVKGIGNSSTSTANTSTRPILRPHKFN